MIRPGARIEFESVPAPAMSIGGRGIAALALPMAWGAEGELIAINSTDLSSGAAFSKIGYTAAEEGSLLFRECLRYCYKLFAWRSDRGGVKASATVAPMTVTALYTGARGNDLEVSVFANGSEYDVVTYLDKVIVDEQTVGDIENLEANAWVTFSGSGEPAATAGTPLTGGTNGTINAAAYSGFFAALGLESWQVMGIIDPAVNIPSLVTDFIHNQRDVQGRKVQGVVYNSTAANYEGIIAIKQGYATESGEEVAGANAVALAVGMSAGAAINESNTNTLVNGAIRILGEMTHDEIVEGLQEGWFILSKRVDGSIKIEQDINTFREFAPTRGKEYRKNRVIRTLDEIGNTVKLTWEQFYEGSADNDQAGRNAFKADLISYFRMLQAERAITGFTPEDVVVRKGNEIDAVVVDAWITPVDSMEKLYMTVYTRVGGEADA